MHAYFLFYLALLSSLLSVFASPVPVANGTIVEDLEKRGTHKGRGTWFNVGTGNCGKHNVDSDHIVAISKSLYDKNKASNCDQWIKIKDVKNGKVFYGKTRDSCPSCSYYDLDLSPSLFKKFESLDKGVLSLSWNFMPKGWSP
jgi:hypothetical protein